MLSVETQTRCTIKPLLDVSTVFWESENAHSAQEYALYQPIAYKTHSSWQEVMPEPLRKKFDLVNLQSFFFIC